MACKVIEIPGGDGQKPVRGIVCGLKSQPKCSYCGKDSEVLCDFPVGKGKTCNRRCCKDHATKQGPDVDFCKHHTGQTPVFGGTAK